MHLTDLRRVMFGLFSSHHQWILSDPVPKDLETVVWRIFLSQLWQNNQTSIKRYKTVTLLLLWLMTKWLYILYAGCSKMSLIWEVTVKLFFFFFVISHKLICDMSLIFWILLLSQTKEQKYLLQTYCLQMARNWSKWKFRFCLLCGEETR